MMRGCYSSWRHYRWLTKWASGWAGGPPFCVGRSLSGYVISSWEPQEGGGIRKRGKEEGEYILPTRFLSKSKTEYTFFRNTSPRSHVVLPRTCCFVGFFVSFMGYDSVDFIYF